MNIRNNITNYLFDKDYLICTYDNYVYLFNYISLISFSDTKIIVSIKNKSVSIYGSNLIIVRITKEEMLIKGIIKGIELNNE